MKFPKPPRAKWLLPLLLALAGGPALANESYAVFGPAVVMVAQFSPEERRAMRERWEQAGPEERLRMRRDYQERQERVRDKREANPRRNDSADQSGYGMGFGVGFERRRDERGNTESQAIPMPPGNFSDPGEFFDPRQNRGGRRR